MIMKNHNVHQLIHSAHHTALAIARAGPEMAEPDQAALYEQVLVALIHDNIGHMSTAELVEALGAIGGQGLYF